ncbi:MAG: hypothetical protein ACM3QZ_10835 [Solirubrobacterales bacterium]
MEKFTIGEALGFAWQRVKYRLGFFMGIILFVFALPCALMFITPALGRGMAIWWMVLMMLATYYLMLGLINISIQTVRGKKPTFNDLFIHPKALLSFIIAYILMYIPVMIGMMFLIIPGFYLFMRWYFFMFYIVERDMGPIEALTASWHATKGSAFHLFCFTFVAGLIGMLGVLALGVGVLVSMPVVMVATARVYCLLEDDEEAEEAAEDADESTAVFPAE